MSRNSFISTTQILRLSSAISANKKKKRRYELIEQQKYVEKETSPIHEINSFDFNISTRCAHISFLEIKNYRTIERYVTQNYVKYPIYSDWKTKTKLIKKTIKLTNSELENLQSNQDPLIKEFAFEIVTNIKNLDLVPSWYYFKTLSILRDEKITLCKEKFENFKNENELKIQVLKQNFNKLIIEKERVTFAINKSNKKINKKQQKLEKISNSKENIFLNIISLGIFPLLHSKRRINKLKEKIDILKQELALTENNKNILIESINDNNKQIENANLEIENANQKLKDDCNQIKKDFYNDVNRIEPLPTLIDNSCADFIPLKKIVGMEYEKIVGCYIIRNREFNKYYVGQSKDVLKRLKQHFNGTEVKNIIFAEDYYKSSYEDKSEIFEVKIIKLGTKDELDSTEKELIEKYDSFNNGYNGTNGNS